MKLILLCYVMLAATLVATQPAAPTYDDMAVVPDADPVPAPPDTVQPSFDAVNGYLAEVMALHKTREQMLGIFFTLEEDSVERETMRIQLRKMTGQMKKLVENITLMLTDMATLRDKKQEARQTQTR